jgi:pimeloyl-ACP methyl ester carboxylesterase
MLLFELVSWVFLMFLFLCRYSWRHQLREFKSEYRVVALDLRGYGETDAPMHRDDYRLDCLITDIKDVLDSLGGFVYSFTTCELTSLLGRMHFPPT